MPRYLIVAYIIIFALFVSAQLYHYETGKALGVNEPNKIIWKNGTFNNYPAEFGTLVVKENRSTRNSRLINIPIIKIKALYHSDSISPIFLLHGGPGESNLQDHLLFKKLVQNRDLVLVGYRGVDGSVKLDCPNMKEALLSDTITLDNAEKMFKNAALSCINDYKAQKIDIYGYSMEEVIEDVEITRKLLNYDSISFLAFSYGTMLAQLYAQRYDSLVNKMVLIGARPLNKFLFEEIMLENKLYKIYKSNSPIGEQNFNKDEFIKTTNKLVNELGKRTNEFRLQLLIYSKLYTLSDINDLRSVYFNVLNNNYELLDETILSFYKKFPSNLVIGDNYLKKQGRISFYVVDSTFDLNPMVSAINTFYNPEFDILYSLSSNENCNPNSINTLIIEGEFDITSLYNEFDEDYLQFFSNKRIVTIKEAGHLDFFYSKENETSEYVVNFFK